MFDTKIMYEIIQTTGNYDDVDYSSYSDEDDSCSESSSNNADEFLDFMSDEERDFHGMVQNGWSIFIFT